tara:strand:- start:869 stop:1270 length:402 start_codon:yes stop_codon:yes gene_type:complete
MSTQLRLRGGTTAEHSSFTGAEREVTVDTTLDTLVVHDGTTAGGIPLAKASDVPAASSSLAVTNVTTSGTMTSTGDITTSGELNAPTVDLGNGVKITSSGSNFVLSINGSPVFSVSASGNLVVSGDMTAFGSP